MKISKYLRAASSLAFNRPRGCHVMIHAVTDSQGQRLCMLMIVGNKVRLCQKIEQQIL